MITLTNLPDERYKEVADKLGLPAFTAKQLTKNLKEKILAAAHDKYPHLKNIDDTKDLLSIFIYIWFENRGVDLSRLTNKSHIKVLLKACKTIFTSPEMIPEKIEKHKHMVREMFYWIANILDPVFENKNIDNILENMFLAIKNKSQSYESVYKFSELLAKSYLILNNDMIVNRVAAVAAEKGFEIAMNIINDINALNHCINILNSPYAEQIIDKLLEFNASLEHATEIENADFIKSISALDKATNLINHPRFLYILNYFIKSNKDSMPMDIKSAAELFEDLNKADNLLNHKKFKLIIDSIFAAHIWHQYGERGNRYLKQLNQANTILAYPDNGEEIQFAIKRLSGLYSNDSKLINALISATAIYNHHASKFILQAIKEIGSRYYMVGIDKFIFELNNANNILVQKNVKPLLEKVFALIEKKYHEAEAGRQGYSLEAAALFLAKLNQSTALLQDEVLLELTFKLIEKYNFDGLVGLIKNIEENPNIFTIEKINNIIKILDAYPHIIQDQYQFINLAISFDRLLNHPRINDIFNILNNTKPTNDVAVFAFLKSLQNNSAILNNDVFLKATLLTINAKGCVDADSFVNLMTAKHECFNNPTVVTEFLLQVQDSGFNEADNFINTLDKCPQIINSPEMLITTLQLSKKHGFKVHVLLEELNSLLVTPSQVNKKILAVLGSLKSNETLHSDMLIKLIFILNHRYNFENKLISLDKFAQLFAAKDLLDADKFIITLDQSYFNAKEIQENLFSLAETHSFTELTTLLNVLNAATNIIKLDNHAMLFNLLLTKLKNNDLKEVGAYIQFIDALPNLTISNLFLKQIEKSLEIVADNQFGSATKYLQQHYQDTEINYDANGKKFSSVIAGCRFFGAAEKKPILTPAQREPYPTATPTKI